MDEAQSSFILQALGFSASELEANRRGLLTETQTRRILIRQVVSFVLINTLLLLVIILDLYREAWSTTSLLILAPIWLIVAVIFIISKFNLVQDLSSGAVAAATGSITLSIRPGPHWVKDYFLKITGMDFGVSPVTFEAVTKLNEWMPKLEYRVYFLPRSKELVSIEPIREHAGNQ